MASQSVLTVSIVTPDGEVYNRKNASMLVVNTSSGQMGIMPNHVPVIASLKIDQVKINYQDQVDKVAVNGGFVEFSHDCATVVANTAEKQNDIDVERAARAKKRAQAAIKRSQDQHDQKALKYEQLALERAINRIHTAKQ